jgi:glycosyltransferase involved in cell wall biosynthesis
MARDLSFARELRAFHELYTTIRAQKPDVLHLNSSKAGILGGLAGRLAGVRKILFTAHGWPHREPRPLLMRAALWIASWLTVAFCTSVIAVSQKDHDDAPVFISRRKIKVIHNGMNPFPLLPRSEARAILQRDTSAISQCDYWFLMNAELHPNKAIDVAIKAFKKHAGTTTGTTLVIIGEGQERTAIEKQISGSGVSDRILLAGFIPEARTYMSAGNAFLLPSRKEGFPLVLLEAGLAQVPVIASRTGGIPEIIEDGMSGLLIPPADMDSLATAMDRLHSNPDTAEGFANTLYKKVTQDFSESSMTNATFALY